jgi:hypothetical protein
MPAAPVRWNYGTEVGRWVLGKGALGTASGHLWLPRAAIVNSVTPKKDPTGEVAYDTHLADRYVLEVLRDGLSAAMGPP